MHLPLSAMTFALFRPPGPAAPRLAQGPDPGDPVPVFAGGAVPECAWPTAVESLSHSITLGCYPASLPSPLSRLLATPSPSAWGTWERLSMVGGAGLQVIR
jgi:hypothetical protein